MKSRLRMLSQRPRRNMECRQFRLLKRLVCRYAPLLDVLRVGTAVQDIPGSGQGTPYRDIGLAVAVIIAGDGNVAGNTLIDDRFRSCGAVDDVPVTIRGAPDGYVTLAVTVKVPGHGNVTLDTPMDDLGSAS